MIDRTLFRWIKELGHHKMDFKIRYYTPDLILSVEHEDGEIKVEKVIEDITEMWAPEEVIKSTFKKMITELKGKEPKVFGEIPLPGETEKW